MSVSDEKIFSAELVDVLKDYGIVTDAQIAEVTEEQSIQGGGLCELLLKNEFATHEQILGCYGLKFGIVPVNWLLVSLSSFKLGKLKLGI